METAGQAAVARKVQEVAAVEPGSLRHRVLVTAQKFKSSWVELGALLVRVRDDGSWEEWGFKSFDQYCSKELRIKRATAEKLTHSYNFLAKHEKGMVERLRAPEPKVAREVPHFEVVSVLADAEERGQLKEPDYQTLREKIWADERPANQVARELTQRYPPPPKPEPTVDFVLRRLASSARRLATELRSCDKVPGAVSERAEALAADVEELASAK